MSARKLPEPPTITASRAEEVLDEILTNRPGWTSDDAGWLHATTGVRVVARAGGTPFRLTSPGQDRALQIGTRVGLEVQLQSRGA